MKQRKAANKVQGSYANEELDEWYEDEIPFIELKRRLEAEANKVEELMSILSVSPFSSYFVFSIFLPRELFGKWVHQISRKELQ